MGPPCDSGGHYTCQPTISRAEIIAQTGLLGGPGLVFLKGATSVRPLTQIN